MITLTVPETFSILTPKDAKKFTKGHVLISKADLKAIAKLAKKLGFYKELKALGVVHYELSV